MYIRTVKVKELFRFFDEMDAQKVWLIPFRAFILHFRDESEKSIKSQLKRYVDDGFLIRVTPGLYANHRAESYHKCKTTLSTLAKTLRPFDQMYLSLDYMANELNMIPQVPNSLTFVTNGRSYIYFTPLGAIEFVHQGYTNMKEERWVEFDEFRGIYIATPEQVIADAKRHRRNYLLGLIQEVAG